MKKLLIILAAVLLLASVVMAVKPTGERQGHAANTGIFGQCGNDAQCVDSNPCTIDTCDMSTKPGQCVNAPVVVAVDDVASTTMNTPVDIDLILNDQVKTELGYGLAFHQPSCGSVVSKSGVLGGICTFTPAPNYCGTCTFVYSLCGPDNACSSEAEVTVDVSCPG